MKNYLNTYLSEVEKTLKKDLNAERRQEICQELLVKISFFQHERLIHLIVTFFTGILCCLFLLGFLILENIFLLVLFLLMLCLFVPYIFHYYFLENNVQKLYKIYDKLKEKN